MPAPAIVFQTPSGRLEHENQRNPVADARYGPTRDSSRVPLISSVAISDDTIDPHSLGSVCTHRYIC